MLCHHPNLRVSPDSFALKCFQLFCELHVPPISLINGYTNFNWREITKLLIQPHVTPSFLHKSPSALLLYRYQILCLNKTSCRNIILWTLIFSSYQFFVQVHTFSAQMGGRVCSLVSSLWHYCWNNFVRNIFTTICQAIISFLRNRSSYKECVHNNKYITRQ
jgi:hypothetical protein